MDRAGLAARNPHLSVLGPGDPGLAAYGRVLDLPGLEGLVGLADRIVPAGLEANAYVASEAELESHPAAAAFGPAFGFAELQVGWNAGPNSRLNGLEWHKSPEILVAVSDLALLLGRFEDIELRGPSGPRFDSSRLSCVFLPRGAALELKVGTLHLAPCRLEASGFKSLVVLPRGTNSPLSPEESERAKAAAAPSAPGGGDPEAGLLFMRNKWILAHPERKILVDKGAFPGVEGSNIEVFF